MSTLTGVRLPPSLEQARESICQAARCAKLDFFDTVFELISCDEMNRIAAYGGFPTRYPHWRFGMQYTQLSKSYSYGLGRIYELVINNDPCYAYLMESNKDIEQKLVMAHVYGHADFFKNNYSFQFTNRKMIDQIANHATKVRRCIDKFGFDKVEKILDQALSLQNLIDLNAPFIKRFKAVETEAEEKLRPATLADVPQLPTQREYMRHYINPENYLERERQKLQDKKDQAQKFPERPQKDVLSFLIDYAPLQNFERDLLSIVRDEAYYFAPQAQTKIMNEGWASFWHTTLLTKLMHPAEIIDFADVHAAGMMQSPKQLNPYKLGLELFRHICHRYDHGKFGQDWEQCDDLRVKEQWHRPTHQGLAKIFEVRKHYNDITFIDEFFTPEFALENRFYCFDYNPKKETFEIVSRDFKIIKNRLLAQLTNLGEPVVSIVDANYENRGELFLLHRHEGIDLRLDYMRATLTHLCGLWRRPVHLLSKINEQGKLFGFNGQHFSETSAAYPVPC